MKLLIAYIKQLPEALRTQLLIRVGSGTVAMLVFFVVLLMTGEFTFALPCLILSVFLFVNCWTLLRSIIIGSYLCVSGPCVEVEKVGFRRRIKSITVRLGEKLVVVPIRRRINKLSPGTTVTLYVSEKTPVYEKDGLCHIYEFLAISFGS